MSTPPRLILASTSPYRRELLTRLGLPFEAVAPGVDEAEVTGETPKERARRLAIAKARAAAANLPGSVVVIGSDQVACLGNAVLHKPGTPERGRAQLAELSGREAHFHTGVAVIAGERLLQHVDTTTVRFRKLDAAEIESYLRRERALDCAGGFKSEGLGVALFERWVCEDPTALVGLPLIWVAGALREAGFSVP